MVTGLNIHLVCLVYHILNMLAQGRRESSTNICQACFYLNWFCQHFDNILHIGWRVPSKETCLLWLLFEKMFTIFLPYGLERLSLASLERSHSNSNVVNTFLKAWLSHQTSSRCNDKCLWAVLRQSVCHFPACILAIRHNSSTLTCFTKNCFHSLHNAASHICCVWMQRPRY